MRPRLLVLAVAADDGSTVDGGDAYERDLLDAFDARAFWGGWALSGR